MNRAPAASKAETLCRALLRLYEQHRADGMPPTSARFLFFRDRLTELLPEPLERVQAREKKERERLRALLNRRRRS
jgi:hypothetical protein